MATIQAPTIVITGDRRQDGVAATSIPRRSPRCCRAAKLDRAAGIGHMLHHAAPEVVIAAIDELAANKPR